MKSFFFVLMILFFFIPQDASACSCGGPTNFLGTIENQIIQDIKRGKEPTLPNILVGTVKSHVKNSLVLEVESVLSGDETRSEVKVWGDNGMLCRPYVSTFPVGTQWVMSLKPIQKNSDKGEKIGDYEIGVCGVYWLAAKTEIQDVLVSGAIGEKSAQSMSLADLKVSILESIELGRKEGEKKITRIKDFGVTCSLTEYRAELLADENHMIMMDGQWSFTKDEKSMRPADHNTLIMRASSTGFRSGQSFGSSGTSDLEVIPPDIQNLQKNKFQAMAVVNQMIGEKDERRLHYVVKLWQGSSPTEFDFGGNPGIGTSTSGNIELKEIAGPQSTPLVFTKTVGLYTEFLGKVREVQIDLKCRQMDQK